MREDLFSWWPSKGTTLLESGEDRSSVVWQNLHPQTQYLPQSPWRLTGYDNLNEKTMTGRRKSGGKDNLAGPVLLLGRISPGVPLHRSRGTVWVWNDDTSPAWKVRCIPTVSAQNLRSVKNPAQPKLPQAWKEGSNDESLIDGLSAFCVVREDEDRSGKPNHQAAWGTEGSPGWNDHPLSSRLISFDENLHERFQVPGPFWYSRWKLILYIYILSNLP